MKKIPIIILLIAIYSLGMSCQGYAAIMADGPYEKFHSNGKLRKKGAYINGKREGLFQIYYGNGILREEGFYKNDKREGMHKEFYKNGSIKTIESFSNNQLEGVMLKFYPNGSIRSFGIYAKGRVQTLQKYTEDGKLVYQTASTDTPQDSSLVLK
ncbi:MAG: hypothetical protein A2787_03485 [Omnitrophica WOR_2 bacterium RIFCSPHIGHO2_01_FULL_48_9]|nr:MAG: hypothetical protein A2787_03485 [Omnitrophica WOR_2 bacterium RIFCSPHIGHO2_01_FULL_48_9]